MSKARKIYDQKELEYKKAIVYCRVSSDRQKIEGHGLDSQEQRCREFASVKEYEVIEVFRDSVSGGGDFMKRPAMNALLDFIDSFPETNFVVIFDDLKRFARDVEFHLKLRATFKARDVKLECLNFNFEDSPESRYVETILAAGSELERNQNSRQVYQKQKARLELGYWAFPSVRPYKMTKDPIHGNLLKVVEPYGSILKEALEGFANGRFLHKIDACKFLVERSYWTKQKPEKYIDKFKSIASDPLYAGFIEYPMWGVERRNGHHEGIISLDVFDAIQKRLKQESKGKRVRNDVSEAFPLRSLLVCDSCGKPLTGSFSKGRGGKYPYYRCQNKDCEFGSKSINANKVHNSFDELLLKQGLKKDISKVLSAVFDRVWKEEETLLKTKETENQRQIEALRGKINQVTDLALKSKKQSLREVFEVQIEEFAEEIAQIESCSIKGVDLDFPYRTALEKVTLLLESPYKIWHSVDVREKQKLFYFIFDERLAYSKKAGYRTDKLPSATRIFEDFATSNSQDVEMAGIEPASELECGGESTVRSKFFGFKNTCLRTNKTQMFRVV
tara:strand:- start:4852 stop:6531 length:1680 start_codon:yes stop_codon:yes gene_type:complete